jgi:hypothetical protein
MTACASRRYMQPVKKAKRNEQAGYQIMQSRLVPAFTHRRTSEVTVLFHCDLLE